MLVYHIILHYSILLSLYQYNRLSKYISYGSRVWRWPVVGSTAQGRKELGVEAICVVCLMYVFMVYSVWLICLISLELVCLTSLFYGLCICVWLALFGLVWRRSARCETEDEQRLPTPELIEATCCVGFCPTNSSWLQVVPKFCGCV